MPSLLTTALMDVAAVLILVFGVYFPRHRRRELVVALLGVNVGVLAVSATLGGATVGAGVGLGLFGVLSIIRLRSTELGQQEVAYYFTALALGLVGGLGVTPVWLAGVLMLAVLLAVFVGDHPKLFNRYHSQQMNLDSAFTNLTGLKKHLELLLGAKVHTVTILKVDLVQETTLVDVRYETLDVTPKIISQRQNAQQLVHTR